MQAYWLKFTDGTSGHCEGQSAFDAVRIAEHLTKKKVAVEDHLKYKPQESEAVKTLPYPARPMIWQMEHPVFGKTPTFCFGGAECRGRGACPRSHSCCD
ncbi:hypothetical protein [Rhodovulum sp. FJ3]|uniref:hypothetical protein n=1 Tax=Rhodovulum sp. FJ3 TaxID=3079053 RepID=UPI00293DF089|nr:hypothetical protein [Rhodovulum sp. FJ3]MDV4167834.1 hypothetical protein [Rhodovulum sp. FJ3]